jgi:hypothetical protein
MILFQQGILSFDASISIFYIKPNGVSVVANVALVTSRSLEGLTDDNAAKHLNSPLL